MIQRDRVIVMTVEQIKKTNNSPKVHSFTINKIGRDVSAEDERVMLMDLFEDMRSDRLQHERKMARSLEFAKSYTCKD